MPSPTLIAAVRHVVDHEQDTITSEELGVDLDELRNALARLENVEPPIVEGATPSDYLGPARCWVTRHETLAEVLTAYLSSRGIPPDVSVADFVARPDDG